MILVIASYFRVITRKETEVYLFENKQLLKVTMCKAPGIE